MGTRKDNLRITLSGDRYTPFSLAKKLGAKAVLESASFSQGRTRYSILMLEEAFRIVQDDSGVFFLIDNQRKPFGRSGDILDALQYVASENSLPEGNIPLPAAGIGFLGYEFCARCETIQLSPQNDELHIPESAFIVGHIYIVFDHFTDTLHLFGLNYAEHEIDLSSALEKLKEKIESQDIPFENAPKASYCKIVTDIEKSKAEYLHCIEEIQKHIVKGNLIQAVPSRRLQLKTDNDPMEVYRRLRSMNPSPYLFFLDFGDFQLVGASPESLVRVRDGVASIRPIAGTCRRGKNAAEDEYLKMKLSADKKERAEHLMLVDLARNDLGRKCVAGSVKLTKNMTCELFSHVIHIVSEVEGKTFPEIPQAEILRSAFPAGTVSGAPKIKAIEIVSSLEKRKRSFYAGAIGYIEADGDLDFCIALRSALRQNDLWTLQAGSGIVHASIPEREWEETNEKLGAMRQAIEGESL